MKRNWELILDLAGEGGSVSIYGSKKLDGNWVFMFRRNETVLIDLLEDEDLLENTYYESDETTDWLQAIGQLFPSWRYLRPKYIHTDFKEQIWKEVSSRDEGVSLRHWERLCCPR